MTSVAGVALGSNLGDRRSTLDRAFASLDALGGTRLLRRSSAIETEPVGGPSQGPFLNAVALLETDLEPRTLLQQMLEIEDREGRVRTEIDGPRTLDLDLLFHGEQVLDESTLTLPHPRAHERDFVLRPLAEIAPEWRHPTIGATASELLRRIAIGST